MVATGGGGGGGSFGLGGNLLKAENLSSENSCSDRGPDISCDLKK